MQTDSVTFVGRTGHELAGRVDRPDDGVVGAWAVFAHCFTCGKDLKPFRHLSRGLTNGRVGVLRFDFTGLGDSGGDFSDSNLTTGAADVIDACKFVETNFAAPGVLIGHSFGGTSVLSAAARVPSARAVVTIASAADSDHLGSVLSRARDETAAGGDAQVRIGGQHFTLKHQFFEDLQTHSTQSYLADLGKALLIMHSPQDEQVDIQNASRLFQAARHPKSFVSLDGADHLMLDPNIAYYAGSVIAAWSQRYLGSNTEEQG